MFNVPNYETMMMMRHKIAEIIADKSCPHVPAEMIRTLNAAQEQFDVDVNQGMKFIEERAHENVAHIQMPIPIVIPAGDEIPPEITSYTRVITLPKKTKPYYQAVLYTEAESMVREWCEIKLGYINP